MSYLKHLKDTAPQNGSFGPHSKIANLLSDQILNSPTGGALLVLRVGEGAVKL